jgi:hypothetical protein
MAASVVTTTVTSHQKVGKHVEIIGTLGIAAGDYVANGLTVDFANGEIKSSRVPVHIEVSGKAGYVYKYVPGATKNVGKLMVFQGPGDANPLAELAAAPTPGGVVGDTINFKALFPALL